MEECILTGSDGVRVETPISILQASNVLKHAPAPDDDIYFVPVVQSDVLRVLARWLRDDGWLPVELSVAWVPRLVEVADILDIPNLVQEVMTHWGQRLFYEPLPPGTDPGVLEVMATYVSIMQIPIVLPKLVGLPRDVSTFIRVLRDHKNLQDFQRMSESLGGTKNALTFIERLYRAANGERQPVMVLASGNGGRDMQRERASLRLLQFADDLFHTFDAAYSVFRGGELNLSSYEKELPAAFGIELQHMCYSPTSQCCSDFLKTLTEPIVRTRNGRYVAPFLFLINDTRGNLQQTPVEGCEYFQIVGDYSSRYPDLLQFTAVFFGQKQKSNTSLSPAYEAVFDTTSFYDDFHNLQRSAIGGCKYPSKK